MRACVQLNVDVHNTDAGEGMVAFTEVLNALIAYNFKQNGGVEIDDQLRSYILDDRDPHDPGIRLLTVHEMAMLSSPLVLRDGCPLRPPRRASARCQRAPLLPQARPY